MSLAPMSLAAISFAAMFLAAMSLAAMSFKAVRWFAANLPWVRQDQGIQEFRATCKIAVTR